MAVFLQKNESTETLGPFLTTEKKVAESTSPWRFYRVLIRWYDMIIRKVVLKTVKAYW